MTRAPQRKASISIVGAGRLGTALAIALARRGYKIEALVARHRSHARRAAELTGASPLSLTISQPDQIPASDILIITTPDDAIESTAEELAGVFRRSVDEREARSRTVLHASGALSSEVLKSLREGGFATGSMHPLVSVSDSMKGAEAFNSAFFCIEGEGKALRVARSIVRALGGKSFSIKAEEKALYHAAAVMASGHVTALFDIASEMLALTGLSESRARAVLLPLLKSTLENLYRSKPAQALTGTFARADAATVKRHLAALRRFETRDALDAYVLLGLRSLRLARAAGANREALREIERALAEALNG